MLNYNSCKKTLITKIKIYLPKSRLNFYHFIPKINYKFLSVYIFYDIIIVVDSFISLFKQ